MYMLTCKIYNSALEYGIIRRYTNVIYYYYYYYNMKYPCGAKIETQYLLRYRGLQFGNHRVILVSFPLIISDHKTYNKQIIINR